MCEFNWPMLLEYLKVVLSWPPLIFVGAMICIWKFQTEIGKVLGRLERFKAGGFEASIGAAQQAQAAKVEAVFPLPGEGPGEAIGAQQPAAPLAQGQPAPIGNAEAIDWAVSDEAVSLLPPLPPGGSVEMIVQWAHRNPGPTVRDFIMTSSALKAERCFNLIFGTQVDLLEYLRLVPGAHTMADLLPFHEKHVVLINAPQPVAVPIYLAFLLNQGLVENVGPPEGPLYQLTRFGQWFLDYIKQFYSLVWNKRGKRLPIPPCYQSNDRSMMSS